MKAHELKTTSSRRPTRVGRGISAGGGKTAGRGTKGQSARTGGKVRPGFEGGQNPLSQRLPKLRGFTSHPRFTVEVLYTGELAKFGAKITNDSLLEAGRINSAYQPVKVIVKGELKSKVAVELQGASAGAIKAIEQAGGSFKTVATQQRAATKVKADKS